jgi:protocatechuate 3,4-dioxygenase beta subunit
MISRRSLSLIISVVVLFLAACSSASPPTVTLQGRVADAYTNQPVASAQVSIDDVQLVTDAEGMYRTTTWTPQSDLRVAAPGYDPLHISLETQPHLAQPVEQTEEQAVVITRTLNLMLRPDTLEGVVTDSYTGQPVAGVQVVAQRVEDEQEASIPPPHAPMGASSLDSQHGTTQTVSSTTSPTIPATTTTTPTTTIISTTTDARGAYALSGVPEHVRLTLRADDYEPVQTTLYRTTRATHQMRPDVLRGTVTDRYSGQPVGGATVSTGAMTTTTTSDGSYLLKGVSENLSLVEIQAEGYAPLSQQVNRTTTLHVSLRPDVLSSRLVDGESGEPVSFATIIATTTITGTAIAFERIDNAPDGQFTLKGMPESGYVQVLAPGYRKAVLEIKPGQIPARIELQPFLAKALYVKTTTAAYMPEKMELFFDTIDTTELNAMVIDLKSDNIADLGLIYYESNVPIIQELGTSEDLMDIRGLLAEAKKRNIYTIARIHVFAHDNLLAETKPEWAAQDTRGCVPGENRRCNGDVFYADWDIAWLDPWNRNVWDYNIQLAIEAAQLGFDEIQFDYIRFPSDATYIDYMKLSKPADYRNNPEPMYENIVTFMEQAHEAINRVGAFFSVDVFGYAIWGPQAKIGQDASRMAPYADYICPMVYPSHFIWGELGFENPAAHPYDIVHASMKYGYKLVGGKRAKIRPWLQDFTLIWVPDHLIVRYGVKEVRAQIEATEAVTYTVGWSLWSADNDYTLQALKPE